MINEANRRHAKAAREAMKRAIHDRKLEQASAIAKLSWPIFTMDFEASGLGEFTYPIEIGVACWASADVEIETWSTLIQPTQEWLEHRIWNGASEAVHGIKKSNLSSGMTPKAALNQANAIIGSHVAFCDGGEHDFRWLLHLAHAADLRPSFRLSDWDSLGGALDLAQYTRMIGWMESNPAEHRAGKDAERLCRAVAVGVGSSAAFLPALSCQSIHNEG